MIAVDMDGTFLSSEKTYNKARFLTQYEQLKKENIRFVVASGNQYYRLVSFFPEICDEITFVAENGAWVVDQGKTLFCGEFSAEHRQKILDVLAEFPHIHAAVCGPRSAWMLDSAPEPLVKLMSNHYQRLALIPSFDHFNETVFKVSLNLPDEQIPELLTYFGHALDGIVTPVSSGFGFIDLIIPGVHKAHGLALLQQQWQISSDEIVAMGDGGNDMEMLSQSGYSFAMANAQPALKQVAAYQTESNNEEGALNVIERVLTRQAPFNQ